MSPYLVWDPVTLPFYNIYSFIFAKSPIHAMNTWLNLCVKNKVAVVYNNMSGKIQVNVIKGVLKL